VKLPSYYKLDEAGEPVACESAREWAVWFEGNDAARVVTRTELPAGVVVSTVFLGIDHAFGDGGAPVLWETMTFGGEYAQACARYQSRDEALVGHELWVLVAKGEMTPFDARRLRSEAQPLVTDDQAPGTLVKKELS